MYLINIAKTKDYFLENFYKPPTQRNLPLPEKILTPPPHQILGGRISLTILSPPPPDLFPIRTWTQLLVLMISHYNQFYRQDQDSATVPFETIQPSERG